MTTHKGYTGVFHVDADAGVIRGEVVDLKDTITFQGDTVPEAVRTFRESVDDYLEFCASLGEAPEKPFSGKFLVRINPGVHRGLAVLAQSKGVSVNKLVTRQLTIMARRAGSSVVIPRRPSGSARVEPQPKKAVGKVAPATPKRDKAKV